MTNLETLVARPPPLRVDQDGVARVGGTRVRLETVLTAFHYGCSAEEILLKYPSLDLKDIYAVIAYYLWNRAEMDSYLDHRRRFADEARREAEQRFPAQGVRERLLARRAAPPGGVG